MSRRRLEITTVIVTPAREDDPEWILARAEVELEDAVTIRDILVSLSSQKELRVVLPRMKDGEGKRHNTVELDRDLWREVSSRILERYREADEMAKGTTGKKAEAV